MKLAEKQAGSDERRSRPEPKSTGPHRSGLAGKKPPPKAAPSEGEEAQAADAASKDFEVRKIVADAVQLGYDVIEDNLALGRAAADRLSAGAYGFDHAKDDVGELSKRLVQLARDLGMVWFDLLEAVVQDTTLREALKPKPKGPKPPSKNPRPGDPASGRPLPSVGCHVQGNDRASADPFLLSRPEGPTRLTVAGLHSPTRGLPPITKVTFVAGKDPTPIVAMIAVPPDQPAGVYNGTVCDYDTHAPLGTLTVRVTA